MTIDVPGINARVAELRRQAAEVMSLLHTAYLPTATYTRSPNPNFPGPEWTVGRRHDVWNIHVAEGQEDVLFVHHPGDLPGDVNPMEIDYARGVAMALLAACAYADLHHQPPPEVPVLEKAHNANQQRPDRPTRT